MLCPRWVGIDLPHLRSCVSGPMSEKDLASVHEDPQPTGIGRLSETGITCW